MRLRPSVVSAISRRTTALVVLLSGVGSDLLGTESLTVAPSTLTLHEREYLTRPGTDWLVFNNTYDGNFSDSKIAGVELIHHGVRTATNGDVRLSPTPEQWDPVAELKSRTVLRDERAIEVQLTYAAPKFSYRIRTAAQADGIRIQVVLEAPLPAELEGRAGFNLEFLPSAYFGHGYYMDDRAGALPLYPSRPTTRAPGTGTAPQPFATGMRLVLAPEEPSRRVTVESRTGELALFDGRHQAQNGWLVVRGLLPAKQSGTVLEWFVRAQAVEGWTRPAVIAHSQVGYGPGQAKVAVIECDARAPSPATARLLRVTANGEHVEALAAAPKPWGEYLRYRYFTFDFSAVRDPGLYVLEAAGTRTAVFRIASDVYATAWQPTLDVFMPVQMDHVFVNDAYRVWHGASHLDDARQAPPNLEHFDLYAMGPQTDSKFAPGEHIPGLNIGGWFDAGDFDLRTQTHYAAVISLVQSWEQFRPMRDETSVDQARRHVELHRPDGVPDMLQQIEHGTLFLISQYRVFGHAIPGIVEPDLGQYTHLGDAVTKTDNRVDDPKDPNSPRDDRLAFTTATTALNYGAAGALAAAGRALRGYREELAEECLATAVRAWDFEKGRTPNLFKFGNTNGGDVDDEELRAALELLVATKDSRYAARIRELWPVIDRKFEFHAGLALRAMPLLGEDFSKRVRARAEAFRTQLAEDLKENPFGVPITRGGWAGSGRVVGFATTLYRLHRAFPDLFGPEHTLRGLEFLHGCHPGSDISLVSAVGTQSKAVAYGANRADFSFIAGGVVPGVLILKPDFPENKEDWPFLWGENEYVINLGPSYLFLAHAGDELVRTAR